MNNGDCCNACIINLANINISVTSTRIIRLDNFYKHNVVLNRIKYHVIHTLYATSSI